MRRDTFVWNIYLNLMMKTVSIVKRKGKEYKRIKGRI